MKKSNNEGDNFWNAAVTLFTFDEPKFAALGLSIGSINGKGLTGETANRCLRTIKQIADSGYDNPEIIYAISVFNDNIGSDRVSDLLSNLLMKEILQYTQRMFDELGVTDMEEYQYNRLGDIQTFKVKYREKNIPLGMLPYEILSPIPQIIEKKDIKAAIQRNEECKSYLSNVLCQTISEYVNNRTKTDVFNLCLNYDLFDNAILNMKERDSYDYHQSIEGQYSFLNYEFHLLCDNGDVTISKTNSVFEITVSLLEHFKFLIERTIINTLNIYKFNETDIQKLFAFITETLKEDLNISVNYEPLIGSGKIEFIIERGNESVLVEFKLTTNQKLSEGYEKQLKTYIKSGRYKKAVYVLLINNNKDLSGFYSEINISRDIEIIYINCRRNTAPSKL